MIYILSGPICSGKTSTLLQWSETRTDVQGILSPVRGDKRFFRDISTGEEFAMEAGTGEMEILEIGRFVFSKRNFEKAIQILRRQINEKGWLVIDEIGPLELQDQGFHYLLEKILCERKEKILLVVREGLVKQVAEKYRFSRWQILTTEKLSTIT